MCYVDIMSLKPTQTNAWLRGKQGFGCLKWQGTG